MNKTNTNYEIHQLPRKEDGTKVYCVDKQVGTMMGCKVYTQVFRGTYEECKKHLQEIEAK